MRKYYLAKMSDFVHFKLKRKIVYRNDVEICYWEIKDNLNILSKFQGRGEMRV